MSVEILKTIKEAEAEAELMRKQSIIDSRQIVVNANIEAQKLKEQLLQAAESEASAIIAKAEAAAIKEIASLEQVTLDECNKISENARSKMDKAINAVMGRIMSTYGNS